MDPSRAIARALKRKGSAAITDLEALGLSRPALFRALKALEQSGQILRVRRGV